METGQNQWMGPSDAAHFLSMFLPESSSSTDNFCEERNIFTCPWMASRSGVESGSCLTDHSNTAQQLGQEVKKAASRCKCWGGTEVKRMRCLRIELSLLPQLNVLLHGQGTWESSGWFLRRRVLKAGTQHRYWGARTGQGQEEPSSFCLGTMHLVATQRKAWEGSAGDQVADYRDCLDDRSIHLITRYNTGNVFHDRIILT